MEEYFLLVSFDGGAINVEAVDYGKSKQDRLKFYYEHIKCNTIDMVEYITGVDIIVDDEGFLITGKPVFELDNPKYGGTMQLAGNLMFSKFDARDGSTTGFSSEEEAIEFAKRELEGNIRVVGTVA